MFLENQMVLIVEDEFLIALDLEETMREAGAEVVRTAATVDGALALIESEKITIAILDVNLGKEVSLAVAETLKRKQVPFIYHSGQMNILASANWPQAPIVSKPARPSELVAIMAATLGV